MLGIGLGIWQLGGNRNLTSASGVAAGLYLDTKANSAFVSGLPSDLASILNVVRATTASDEYADGSLVTVGTNVARYGGGQGLLIERSATNTIRNSTNVGATAGTPGTLPTNWVNGVGSGLSASVASVGSVNGIPCTGVRIAGTATSSGSAAIRFENTSQVAAAQGQSWTDSAYVAVVGGSTANLVDVALMMQEIDGGGSQVAFGQSVISPGANLARYQHPRTLTAATTAFIRSGILIDFIVGAVIDITLLIGGVQLESGPKATAFIPTSTVAVTRNSDQIKITGTPLTAGIGAGASFTIFAEYEAYISTNSNYILGVCNDGTPDATNAIYPICSTARQSTVVVASGGVDQFTDAPATVNTPPTLSKMAMRVAVNDFAVSHNGAAAITDVSGAMPVGTMDRIVLGSAPTSPGTQALNGRMTRFAAWPSLLSNADLVALST